MTFIFPAPPPVSIPIQGGGDFPVRRIFCVGQNYADHVREMGGDPAEVKPTFFTKPADAVVASGTSIPYPPRTENLHWEMELVVAIGTGGADIPAAEGLDHVFGYACGLDLTRRDLQSMARKAGQPWEMAKGFDNSAPVGTIVRAGDAGDIAQAAIRLTVNGVVKQDSNIAQLIWTVPDIVAALSTYVTLAAGDLIFTGTPSGVGPLSRGDRMVGHIDGLPDLEVTIAE